MKQSNVVPRKMYERNMLKDGFLRFCDGPEIACCKAVLKINTRR